jgi:UPF0716 protein FxsA
MLLLLLLVVLPIVELLVFIQVASWIGVAEAILLLVVVSIAGVYLAKRSGLSVWRRMVGEMHEGRVPAASIVDGALILLGGVLLLLPGFLSDVIGIALLLPPTRAGVRAFLRRHWAGRVAFGTARVVDVASTARRSTSRATRTPGSGSARALPASPSRTPDRPSTDPPPSSTPR